MITLKEVVIILIGLMTSSFGTSIFYNAELGSSPMATFCDGVHTVFGISYGTANTLVNLLLLIVLFFLNRKYINIGTVLCVFAIGPFVNLFTSLLSGLAISNWNIFPRILCTILGTTLMGVGLGLYVAVDRGLGALEGLVKVLCEKSRFSYSKAKIIQDIILVAGGIAMSARWGIGTIIAMFLTGPVLQASIGFFSKRMGLHRESKTVESSAN
ncbi:MAG: YitT family protein [Spirochaetaceae bacterium]|nr:YitT family protein [Spirochaetaceae bacterium]